jgi:uncharacterized protein YciI
VVSAVQLEPFALSLLLLAEPQPELTPEEAARLQDEHMGYLASLFDGGELVVAGPVKDVPPGRLVGFSIYRCSPERAVELGDQDPAVRRGKYVHEVHPWLVPDGVLATGAGRLPRPAAEVGA